MSRLTDEIKQTFDLETLRREAMKILNKAEWAVFVKVQETHQAQRRFTQRAHKLEYKERVTQARLRLINKAGAKDRDLKPRWFGNDRFDKDAINRQAHNQVHQAYQSDLARINRDEAQEITQLIEASEHNRVSREKPRRDFARAADRRVGTDRRSRTRSL